MRQKKRKGKNVRSAGKEEGDPAGVVLIPKEPLVIIDNCKLGYGMRNEKRRKNDIRVRCWDVKRRRKW